MDWKQTFRSSWEVRGAVVEVGGETPGAVEDVVVEAEEEEGRWEEDQGAGAGEDEEGEGGRTRNISDIRQIYLVKRHRYVYTSCLSLRILANHTMNLFKNKIL